MSTVPYGTVKIDGQIYPLVKDSRPNEVATDRFPGKITIGDYTVDSNDLLSSWNITDLSGGHGVVDLREGVTDNRYQIGTIYTRHPSKWSKPFRITRSVLNGGAGDVTPLGDMYHTGAFHFFFDLNGSLWENTTNLGSLGGALPTNRSVVFQGLAALPYLYVPQGTGYATYEPVGATRTSNATEDHIAFLLWNQQLIGIDDDGQLYHAETAAPTTVFTAYGAGSKLDASMRPKNLLNYWNRSNERSIYVVSDSGLWAFDPATPALYEIPDINGVHPKFGEASCVWNGNLYIAAGMDIIEFNGSVGRNIGLSRDDGLPDLGLNPYVADLVAAQNSMYAMVRSTAVSGSYVTSIHEYSSFGWLMVESREVANTGVGIAMSRAGGTYRLIWGGGDGNFSAQSLPMDYTNPSVVAASSFGYATGTGVSAFASTYYMYSGYFDANMPNYVKLASSLRLDIEHPAATDEDVDDVVIVDYRVDNDTAWTRIATRTFTGATTGEFGTIDAQGVYPGIPFSRIQLRVGIGELTDNTATSPRIKSVSLAFLKMQNPSWSWTIQLDLEKTHGDRSPDEMYTDLVALKDDDRFYAIQMLDGPEGTFRARIAAMSAVPQTGTDRRRQVQLNVIEVRPTPGVLSTA